MRFTEMKRNSSSLKNAIVELHRSHRNGWTWLSVKNSKGAFIELGGLHSHNGLQLQANICSYKDGEIHLYDNGYVRSNCTVGHNCMIGPHHNDGFQIPTIEQFCDYIDNTNFIKNPTTSHVEYREVITRESIKVWNWKSENKNNKDER